KTLVPVYETSKVTGLTIVWAMGMGIIGIALGAALDQNQISNSADASASDARTARVVGYIFCSLFFSLWSGWPLMVPSGQDNTVLKQYLHQGGAKNSTALIIGGGICLALGIAMMLGLAFLDPFSSSASAVGLMIGGAIGGAVAAQVVLWQ